jgi:tRNA-specific 2-thiouridylase
VYKRQCIRCNPLVKFKLLLDYANEHDLEAISTGHYARIRQNADGSYSLLRAIDLSKDQSYMLCYLNQEILSKTLFPLGYTAKTDNKRIAKEMGLSVSDEPESQDLCFVNKNSYQDYIKQFSPEILKPGNIINVRGEILGRHAGLALYTIGQRKGIKIASKEAYYVIDKDISNNRLVVGYQSELGKKEMLVEQVNWISGIPPVSDVCDVKIRYRSKLNKCRIVECKESNNYMVYFNEPIRDITPGQYAVFYQEDEMLGGGMIKQHV